MSVGLAVLTPVLTALREHLALSTVFLLYLCLVVGIAALGGWWPAVAGSVAAFLLVNWYFVPPLHQLGCRLGRERLRARGVRGWWAEW